VALGFLEERRETKLKTEIRTMLIALFVTVLFSSTMLVMVGHAETFETTASLYIAPSPVGVGQTVSGIALIQPDPPTGEIFGGLTLKVTRPDGLNVTLGPFSTDAQGVCRFTYVPAVVGTFGFVLHFPGQTFGDEIEGPTYTFTADDSDLLSLVVQETPVPLEVPVIPGEDVTVYPDPADPKVSLHFEEITSTGTAAVSKTVAPPAGVSPLTGIIGFYYDFEVTFTFTGPVEVGLPYVDGLSNEEDLSMWHYEGGVVGDVNGDGKVDWRDLLRITLALGSKPGARRWNANCDLNGDNKVTLADFYIAWKHYGEVTRAWVDVTTDVDTAANIVYGSTANFPPFGIRHY